MIEDSKATKQVSRRTRRVALLWSIMILILIIVVPVGVGFFGYRPLSIHGRSMDPTLRNGDAILVKNVDPTKVQLGDIVVLQHPNKGPIAHRVLNIESLPRGSLFFQTKGDANQLSEWWTVTGEKKIAVAFIRARLIGHALEFSQTVPGIILLSASALALMVVLTKLFQSSQSDTRG